MPRSVATFLMFEGVAEEAMTFYATVFSGWAAGPIERYGAGEGAAEGAVKRASVRLAGHDLMFFDSPVEHAFTFTPSISLFVECETEAELDQAFEKLMDGGQALMPVDDYGFSRRFGWVNDRYGVSWQLNVQ